MKRTIAGLLITMLCACGIMMPPEAKTSNRSMDNKSTDNQWVGHTIDELVVTIGEPSNVYMLEGGGRVLEYLNLKKATTNTQSSTQPALSAAGGRRAPRTLLGEQIVNPGDQAVLPSGALAVYRAKRKNSASDQSQGCIALFHISASDIIESWSTEGGECK